MLERCAGGFSVILENQNVAEALVVLEVQHAVAEGPEHVFDLLFSHRCQSAAMVGRFDDDLVRADAVHPIEEPFAFPVQVSLDAQRGKFVGNDAHLPARCVRAASIAPVLENLGRRLGFMPVTKRADADSLDLDALAKKIRRPFGSIRRNNDPSSSDGILSQLGQRFLLAGKTTHFNIGHRRKRLILSLTDPLSLAEQSQYLLGGKSALVESHDGSLAGRGFNRENVKSERRAGGAVLADKLPGHSRKVLLFSGGDRILGRTEI